MVSLLDLWLVGSACILSLIGGSVLAVLTTTTPWKLSITLDNDVIPVGGSVVIMCSTPNSTLDKCLYVVQRVFDMAAQPIDFSSGPQSSDVTYERDGSVVYSAQYAGTGLEDGHCGMTLDVFESQVYMIGCHVRSAVGTWKSEFARLKVNDGEPLSHLTGFLRTMAPGAELPILCRAESPLDTCNVWLQSTRFSTGAIVDLNTKHHGSGMIDGECGVVIRAVMVTDNGPGLCYATYVDQEEGKIDAFAVVIEKPPVRLKLEISKTTLKVGKTLHASCTAFESRPAANITWYIGAERLGSGSENTWPNNLEWPWDSQNVRQNISLVLRAEDDGAILRCVADHYAQSAPKTKHAFIRLNRTPRDLAAHDLLRTYHLFTTGKTYNQAWQHCQDNHATRLANTITETQLYLLTRLLASAPAFDDTDNNATMLVGARYNARAHTITSRSGYKVSADEFHMWSPGEPNNASGYECVALLRDLLGYVTVSCDRKYAYVCELPLPSMIYFEEADMFAYNQIQNPVENDYGLKTSLNMSGLSWQESVRACRAHGRLLLIVNSDEEGNDAVQAMMWNYYPPWVFVGARRNQAGSFITMLNEPLEDLGYVKWAPGQPDNRPGNDCLGFVLNGRGHITVRCNDTSTLALCEYDARWYLDFGKREPYWILHELSLSQTRYSQLELVAESINNILQQEIKFLTSPSDVLQAIQIIVNSMSKAEESDVTIARQSNVIIIQSDVEFPGSRGVTWYPDIYDFTPDNASLFSLLEASEQHVGAITVRTSRSLSNKRLTFFVYNVGQSSSPCFIYNNYSVYIHSVVQIVSESAHQQYTDHIVLSSPMRYADMKQACASWDSDNNVWSTDSCKTHEGHGSFRLCVCKNNSARNATISTDLYMIYDYKPERLVDPVATQGSESGIETKETNVSGITLKRNYSSVEVMRLSFWILSGIGLFVIGLTAVLFEKWREEQSNQILLHMMASSTLYLTLNVILLTFEYDKRVGNDQRGGLYCIVVLSVVRYSFNAQNTWILVMSLLQLKRLLTVLGSATTEHLVGKVCLFAWGLPFVPVVVLLCWNARDHMCTDSVKTPFYVTVLVPHIAVVVMSFAILIYIAIHICGCTEKDEIRRHGVTDWTVALRRLKTVVFLFFLFGVPTSFDLLHEYVFKDGFVLLLHNVTDPLQGFVMFVFFVLLDDGTRARWVKRLCPQLVMLAPKTTMTNYSQRSQKSTSQSTRMKSMSQKQGKVKSDTTKSVIIRTKVKPASDFHSKSMVVKNKVPMLP